MALPSAPVLALLDTDMPIELPLMFQTLAAMLYCYKWIACGISSFKVH